MKEMKKLSFLLLSLIILLSNITAFAEEEIVAPDVEAHAYILMDMKTGRVIHSKNEKEQLYPASTTKILTGILALELGNLDDVVTADVASLAPITNEDSHMGILIGEQLTMEQLINGMMVYSANDAANVIATHISGTSSHFVELMNVKAQELGAANTNFVNTYGIHDPNHYTTAEDLAIISRYAMGNEKFREIVKQKTYHIPPTNKYTTERVLSSTNLFIGTARSPKYYYSAVTGVKTGYTSDAGYCLVSSAEKDGTELLCVVMKCKNQEVCYTSSKKLLDFGFENYKNRTIAKAGDVVTDSKVYEAKNDARVAFTVSEDIEVLLPAKPELSEIIETVYDIPETVKAPIKKGDVIGRVSYNYNGELVGWGDLVATNDVERDFFLFIYHLIVNILLSPLFYIPVVLIVAVFIMRRINIMKQERRRRLRRLHSRQQNTGTQVRTGTRRPVNTRFEDQHYRRRRK